MKLSKTYSEFISEKKSKKKSPKDQIKGLSKKQKGLIDKARDIKDEVSKLSADKDKNPEDKLTTLLLKNKINQTEIDTQKVAIQKQQIALNTKLQNAKKKKKAMPKNEQLDAYADELSLEEGLFGWLSGVFKNPGLKRKARKLKNELVKTRIEMGNLKIEGDPIEEFEAELKAKNDEYKTSKSTPRGQDSPHELRIKTLEDTEEALVGAMDSMAQESEVLQKYVDKMKLEARMEANNAIIRAADSKIARVIKKIQDKDQKAIKKMDGEIETLMKQDESYQNYLKSMGSYIIKEGKMPKKYIGNDEIVFLKTKEDSRGANYNLYYKGHDIDVGGRRFGSEKELEDFASNYILSNQLYRKLRYEDSIPLPESIDMHYLDNAKDSLEPKKVYQHLGVEYGQTRRGDKYVMINYIPVSRPQSQQPEWVKVFYDNDKDLKKISKELDMDLKESVLNEEDSYNDYPAAAKKNAQMAIDWKEKYGRDEVDAGTAVGWARAHQLAKGENISADTIKRMSSFNRHRKNSTIATEYKETPWKDKGYVSWLIWGGTEGVDWAMKKSKELDNMKESKHIQTFEAYKNSQTQGYQDKWASKTKDHKYGKVKVSQGTTFIEFLDLIANGKFDAYYSQLIPKDKKWVEKEAAKQGFSEKELKRLAGIDESLVQDMYAKLLDSIFEGEEKPGPDPYMRGLSDKDEEKKKEKMKKQADMDDDDSKAYKEMPGDKEARKKGEVKTSKHVKNYHELYGDKKDESVVTEAKAVKRFDKKLIDDKFQVHQESTLKTIYKGVSGNVDYEIVKKWRELKGLEKLPEEWRGQQLGTVYQLKRNLYLWVKDMEDTRNGRAARDEFGDAFFNVMSIFTFDNDEIVTLWERPLSSKIATYGGPGVNLQYESVVTEGKTISSSKISMMGAKVLNKISIGTIFDTEDGEYEITDYGQQANAFKEFEAEHNGKQVKVKLTAMYGVKLEVTDDVRSARFNKEVRLNSIILESVVNEGKISNFKFGQKKQYSFDDINDLYGFWGTLEVNMDPESIEEIWYDVWGILTKDWKFSDAGALYYLNAKAGRWLADKVWNDINSQISQPDAIDMILSDYARPSKWKAWAREYNEFAQEEVLSESFIQVIEGVMSDIHILMDEVKDEDEFVKKFFKEYGAKIKKTSDSEKWVKDLYNDTMNEARLNEKVKILLQNVLSKMIPAGFGASTSPKMREEMREAVAKAIIPILKDYNYIVQESNDVDSLASAINSAIISIDDSMHYRDFAEAVAKVIRDEYGSHLYVPFQKEIKKALKESLITEEKAKGDRGPIDDDKIEKALKTKSEETGVPIGLIRIVMRRGMAAWRTGHRPGATEQQWGYARVNAFLTKGDGTWGDADSDVAKDCLLYTSPSPRD